MPIVNLNLKNYQPIPSGEDYDNYLKKTKQISSRFMGVSIDVNKGTGTITWKCRVRRKRVCFTKRFPFTPRGEELAGETYKKIIDALQSTA